MDDRELGRRIGYWRRRRKLTQSVFADRIGMSKSWIEKVERGERSAGRLQVLDAICQVLQIDIAALIGEEPPRKASACLDHSEVDRIRSALERYALGPASDDSPPDLPAIRRRLDHMWTAFEFADYQVMGAMLPDLLDDAQSVHGILDCDDSGKLLTEAYQIIASTLRKLGEYELAWLAGDRGIAVAQHAGDPVSVASIGFRIANALLSMGRLAQALALNVSLADSLQPECRSEDVRALYGHVLLQAAMAAAAAGDQRRASELIAEGGDVARFVTPGSNHHRLAFEPVNVALHEVAALAVLGENGLAVEIADSISGESLQMLRKERRAALIIDIARAYSQAGNRDEALHNLLRAEQIASPEARCRPVAQAIIADLLHRFQGKPPLALAGLAERAAVRP